MRERMPVRGWAARRLSTGRLKYQYGVRLRNGTSIPIGWRSTLTAAMDAAHDAAQDLAARIAQHPSRPTLNAVMDAAYDTTRDLAARITQNRGRDDEDQQRYWSGPADIARRTGA